jgi:hypothetical protein
MGVKSNILKENPYRSLYILWILGNILNAFGDKLI